MAVVFFCALFVLCVRAEEQISLEYQKHRPLYAGITGGNNIGLIPPKAPWPSIAENYANYGSVFRPQLHRTEEGSTTEPLTSIQLIDEIKDNTTSIYDEGNSIKPNSSVPTRPLLIVDRFKETTTVKAQEDSTVNSGTRPITPKPVRPSFAGESVIGVPPQSIQPGKPWPARPEDYEGFNATSEKPLIVDRFKETTTVKAQEDNTVNSGTRPITPKPVRPSFAGESVIGVPSQSIKPGKPWPARPEDYEGFNATSEKPLIVDRFKETTTVNAQEDNIVNPGSRPITPKPVRPSFAGESVIGVPSQSIKPGKPWPARPEDYEGFNATSEKPLIVDRFKETTTVEAQVDNTVNSGTRPITPKPVRPSFAGESVIGVPSQSIKPGKPWPARPEDYEGFNATSEKPLIVDRFKETTTVKAQEDNSVNSGTRPITPKPGRPSFAGQSAIGVPPQSIKPGKPWPEGYQGFSATSQNPLIVERFKEKTTVKVQEDNILNLSTRPITPKTVRPSFAGGSVIGVPLQSIKPGKPWPASPEGYQGFSAASQNPLIVDRFKETTTVKVQEDNIVNSGTRPITAKPGRPSFAGGSVIGVPPQSIKPGKPWPASPEGYQGFSATSQNPLIVDRFKETTTVKVQEENIVNSGTRPITPKPGRPSFAGGSVIGVSPQSIKPGKPWSAESEAHTSQKHTVDRFEETTTDDPQEKDNLMNSTETAVTESIEPNKPDDFRGSSTTSENILVTGELVETERIQASDFLIPDYGSDLTSSSESIVSNQASYGTVSQSLPLEQPWFVRYEDHNGFYTTPAIYTSFPNYVVPPTVNMLFEPLASKPWPTRQAEDLISRMKDELPFPKRGQHFESNLAPANHLLSMDSPLFRHIFKHRNPWVEGQQVDEVVYLQPVGFRPEENLYTSAPVEDFLDL